jgi:hypothetical protein
LYVFIAQQATYGALAKRTRWQTISGKCDRGEAPPRIPRERFACLARKIHPLGERPLYELFDELDAGRELGSVLESYARLDRYAGFIQTLNGDRLPTPKIVAGRRR